MLYQDLWTIRTLYFIVWAAIGLFYPFISVYYRSIGLSGTQIGLIGTLGPLLGAGSAMLSGLLSDRFGKVRWLLSVASIGVIAATLGLANARTFLRILPAAGLLSLSIISILSLLDSTTIRLLGERSGHYGLYRLWGTVGFVVTSAIGGFVFERTGLRAMFVAYPCVMVLFLVACWRLRDQPVRRGGSRIPELQHMVRQPAWLILAASSFLVWLVAMGGMGFLGVTIRDMGGSERLVGLAATIAALMEIPLMLASASLLKRFGAVRVIAASFLGYSLRMLLYGVMPAPSWVLGINLLQAASYSPFLTGTVAYVNELASDELKATSQGLFAAVMNLASVAGALVSGWLFDHIGPPGLYRILAGTSTVAFLLFATGMLAARKASLAKVANLRKAKEMKL